MNQKKAKQLRKMVCEANKGTKEENLYKTNRKGTIELEPLSSRGMYQILKRRSSDMTTIMDYLV